MEKLLIIKGIFNDVFTNYEDKESNVSMIVDLEKDCKCSSIKKCAICKLIEKHGLTDIPENENL